MNKTPRQRAEACFATARSTTFDGERNAAIGRGKAICAKHGLDLDDFDIPGRSPQRAKARSSTNSRAHRPHFGVWDDEILRAAAKAMADDLHAKMHGFARAERERESLHIRIQRAMVGMSQEQILEAIEQWRERQRMPADCPHCGFPRGTRVSHICQPFQDRHRSQRR